MFHTQLASQSEMRLEQMDNGSTEVKWCIFTKGMRGPIAKIIVDTRQTKLVSDNNEPSAHIVNVFVRPEFRGKQLGEHLVRLAQVAMKDNGFVWLTLEAEENVEFHGKLVRLYERCGFQVYPVMETYPMEYNDDECFRKVPMRCNLKEMQLNTVSTPSPTAEVTTTTTTTTTTPAGGPRAIPGDNRYRTITFVEEMKREALQILAHGALNVDIPMAMEWIDQHLMPGSLEHSLRTGMHIKSLGHPDWMELAGYLRHLGRIQEKWMSWHAPFMVEIHPGPPVTSANTDDEEDEDDVVYNTPMVKSGPLPNALCVEENAQEFIDPERYTQQGVDESVLTWGPCEYAYMTLEFANRSSAPHEMSQVLRYCQVDAWLKTEEFTYLESWGDSDLKQLTMRFKEAMDEASTICAPLAQGKQMDEAKARFLELVDKYVSEVRVM